MAQCPRILCFLEALLHYARHLPLLCSGQLWMPSSIKWLCELERIGRLESNRLGSNFDSTTGSVTYLVISPNGADSLLGFSKTLKASSED